MRAISSKGGNCNRKSGWVSLNCSLSCCNFFLPSVCNFVLFQLLTCFTIEFMLHTTNYASRFTPLDLRYKNGNTVAISENWYQIWCGPKSSPKRTRISCIYKAQNRWLCYFPGLLLCVLCKLFPSAQQSLASLATKQTADFHFPMKELLRGDLGRVLGKHLQLQLTDRRSALRTT